MAASRKRKPSRGRCPRRATPPMLVSRGLMDDELELRERQFVEAFSGGWANKDHFDSLADMRNVTTIAAAEKDDQQVLDICNAMSIPLQNIRIRYQETGRFGATGDELRLMRAFVEVYRDFWMRQPVRLYEDACDGLQRHLNNTESKEVNHDQHPTRHPDL